MSTDIPDSACQSSQLCRKSGITGFIAIDAEQEMRTAGEKQGGDCRYSTLPDPDYAKNYFNLRILEKHTDSGANV